MMLGLDLLFCSLLSTHSCRSHGRARCGRSLQQRSRGSHELTLLCVQSELGFSPPCASSAD